MIFNSLCAVDAVLKPNQIDKLDEKTLKKPDKVVEHDNGNIRYERNSGATLAQAAKKGNVSAMKYAYGSYYGVGDDLYFYPGV